jgi:hypothetical protein
MRRIDDAEHGSGQNGVDDFFDFDWRLFHGAVWTAAVSSGWCHRAEQQGSGGVIERQ